MRRGLERWGRWVAQDPLNVVVVWVVIVIAGMRIGPSFSAVADRQNVSSLPASAPSVRADQLGATAFAGGQAGETNLIVLTDSRGISSTDVTLMQRIVQWLRAPATRPAHLAAVTAPGPHRPISAFESADHRALQVPITWDTDNDNQLQASAGTIETYLTTLPRGTTVQIGLVGAAAVTHDLMSSLTGGGGAGSLVGLLIILVVLGFVYRSPLAVLVPLVTVGFAFLLALRVISWLGAAAALPVASFSLQFVLFVLLGVGTNYGVFFLSRYREELRRGSSLDAAAHQAALGQAVGGVGEAIGSSALTVMAATAIMGLAQLALLKVTGPAVAVSVACLLLAGLTLLPALMALPGRFLFWPVMPHLGRDVRSEAAGHGLWARAGRLVIHHPRLVATISVLVLLPLALSTLRLDVSFDDLRSLPSSTPAVQSFHTFQQHFPDLASVQVYVSWPGHDLRADDRRTLVPIAQELTSLPHVVAPSSASLSAGSTTPGTRPTPAFSRDGAAARFSLALDVPPESTTASRTVAAIYTRLRHTLGGSPLAGASVLVGGESARVYDEGAQLGTDFRLIAVLVTVVIYLILAVLLRSLVAPLYLLGTIALSAGTAIGLTALVYRDLLGQPIFYLVPVFAFIFLVALGEDFNILMMTRTREEITRLGHPEGIAVAVALTGVTISSAGLVMAASFSRLAQLPVLEAAESGFAIVAGVLVDTFVVRPLLVPAIVMLLGRWNWLWPGQSSLNPTDRPDTV